MKAEQIQQLLETQLPGCTAKVEGEDGRHFSAVVISADFIGKSKVQQQQMVYAVLGEHIKSGAIHALSLKTGLPDNQSI